MSSTDPTVPFVPSTDIPLQGQDAVNALQLALEGTPSDVDFVISPDDTSGQPIGRSWAFDFRAGGFVKAPGALSPLQTSDLGTLATWIEKCLRTARGAHPVHPPGYGVQMGTTDLIGGPVGQIPPDLYARVEDALTFHPRISACENFSGSFDPDDDRVFIDFVVVLDDDAELNVSNLGLTF